MSNIYSFRLSMKWQQIESAVDAIDVWNSIIAITLIIQEIAKQNLWKDSAEKLNIQVCWFKKGSLTSLFQLFLENWWWTAISLLPMLGVDSMKWLVEWLVSYFELKKHLKGNAPKEIIPNMNWEVNIINAEWNSIIVNKNTYNISFNPSVSWQAERLIAPLLKEWWPVEEIALLEWIDSNNNDIISSVKRDEAIYFEDNSELQEIQMTLSGVITKIDMKALTWYLTLWDNRPRVSLIFPRDISNDQVQLIHKSSMNRLSVYVKWKAYSTYQWVVKKIAVLTVMEYQELLKFDENNNN